MKDAGVFVSAAHPGKAVDYLASQCRMTLWAEPDEVPADKLLASLKDQDAILAVLQNKLGDCQFKALPRLKVVANVAVGVDNIDIAAATQNGVLVVNTPGVLDHTTADLAFGLLLAVSRRIVEADKFVRDGQWTRWTFDLILGTDVTRKTLGIVGMGRIGQSMARRARGFDMKVLYFQRNAIAPELEKELGAKHVSLDELLRQSDFVSLHCPLTPDTRHLIGKRELELMKPEAFLINTARGAVVDEPSLVQALTKQQIKGAGLDVFEDEPQVSPEFLSMPNVVLAPHIGSASIETRSNMAQLAVDGLLSALSGKLPANAVNPEVWPAFLKRLEADLKVKAL